MKKAQGSDSDVKVARVVDAVQEENQDNLVKLSTGVVLRGKLANPTIFIMVMAANPRPEPPLVYIKEMGRQMENEADPDYLERVQAWKVEYSDRLVTAMIMMGTELVSAPKKLGKPQEDDWLEEYSLLGMPMMPESKSWRYLTWVKFKGMSNEQDMQAIMDVVGRLNGVREPTVKSAEEFPGSDEKRPADHQD